MERVAASLPSCSRVFLAFDGDDAGLAAAGSLRACLDAAPP